MTEFEKGLVRFPAGDGECVGDLYLPAGTEPAPVVVMAHGIGAERVFGLGPYAERFARRGLAVLVFDYRTFGDSPGEPRCLVSPRRHVVDYLAALDFVRAHPRLAPRRIALWGTSFSGGHVLVAAARAPEGVRAVLAQVPFVSGVSSTLAYPLRLMIPALVRGLADVLASVVGLGPVRVPVARKDGLAVLASPDSWDGYMSLVPEETEWPGRVPARILLTIMAYRPLGSASRIRAPTLLVAARDDDLCPIGAVRKAARRIPDCRLVERDGGHFAPYHGEPFEEVSRLEADFLVERLEAGSGPPAALRPPTGPRGQA